MTVINRVPAHKRHIFPHGLFMQVNYFDIAVLVILLAFGINVERLQTMCAAGTVIGVLMLVWEHFDRWDYRRLGE